MNRHCGYINRDCDFLRNLSRKHSEPELMNIADRIEELLKHRKNLFLDHKPHMKLTEEQRFDRYGLFDIVTE